METAPHAREHRNGGASFPRPGRTDRTGWFALLNNSHFGRPLTGSSAHVKPIIPADEQPVVVARLRSRAPAAGLDKGLGAGRDAHTDSDRDRDTTDGPVVPIYGNLEPQENVAHADSPRGRRLA